MNFYEIERVEARQIFDSRANPTVEVEITLAGGAKGRGIVPSGASTGAFEVLELRDGGGELGGKSVRKAISYVENVLAPALTGMDVRSQSEIDQMMIELDGTPNKSRLGANAILGCSMAAAHAGAAAKQEPLFRYLGGCNARMVPLPMVQILGGGAHALHSIDIQDFLVIPIGFPTFEEGIGAVVNVYNAAKKRIMAAGRPTAIADEGGFWPFGFQTNEEGLWLLTQSIQDAGYRPGVDMGIALDVAASEFYNRETGRYELKLENRSLSSSEMVDMLCEWVEKYPIVSVEDACSEFDWEGSVSFTRRMGGRIQVIGDDLFTTNISRIRTGVEKGACNAVLIKMNQIGTITETMEAIEYTKNHGYLPVISARSGETEDSTIVHLAIASNAGQLKVGSAARGERTVKWNEAIRMEQLLGKSGIYPAGSIFDRIRRRRL